MISSIFDFGKIKKLFARNDFSFIFDGMHGIAGPYAKKIFHEMLGAKEESLHNCVPKEDFNGGHPDPNLTYAESLVEEMDVFNKVDLFLLICF